MPTIYIRTRETAAGKRYDVRYRVGGRYTAVEHGGTFTTKKAAATRMGYIEDLLAAGKDPKVELARKSGEGMRLGQLHDDWLASRRISDHTRRGYQSRRDAIVEALGKKSVDLITTRDVIDWISGLEEDYKPGTVRLFVTQLRLVLDFADHLEVNVARDRRVELPRVIRNEMTPPNAGEVLAALRGVNKTYRLPIITMERLGSRVTETCTLTPGDIDVDAGRVRFARERTKGQRVGRVLEAPQFLVEALADRLPFTFERRAVGDALRTYSFSPHDLRHRRISLWHQSGIPAVELARRSGHSRASMSLDVYSHVMPLDEIDDDALAEILAS